MFDIFQHPWALVAMAVLVLFGLFTWHSVFPEKNRKWHWLLPVLVIGLGFGLDGLVRTDLEKVHATIKTSFKAVQDKDYQAIESVLAEDYSDSLHDSKAELMAHCRVGLEASPVAGFRKTGSVVELSDSQARVTLFANITFDEDSSVAQNYKAFAYLKIQILLARQSDRQWRISRIEILEVDKQPIRWQDVSHAW